MDTVRRGIKAIRELQDYVDAQAGGPGKGFFQIVTDPYEARRVINQGRMAVVLEIEISEPFDCRDVQQPTCDQAQVDRQLDEMYKLGVRSMLLLNKFDNPLTGVRFDSGADRRDHQRRQPLERRRVLERAHVQQRVHRQHDLHPGRVEQRGDQRPARARRASRPAPRRRIRPRRTATRAG